MLYIFVFLLFCFLLFLFCSFARLLNQTWFFAPDGTFPFSISCKELLDTFLWYVTGDFPIHHFWSKLAWTLRGSISFAASVFVTLSKRGLNILQFWIVRYLISIYTARKMQANESGEIRSERSQKWFQVVHCDLNMGRIIGCIMKWWKIHFRRDEGNELRGSICSLPVDVQIS